LKAEQGKQAVQVRQQSQSIEQTQQASAGAQKTTISSYGEIGYTRPTKSAKDAQVDVGRAVVGITHRFDPKTKMVSEFEWEHAITSAGDKGEAAVEQLYVEHETGNGLRAKGGLFLIPAGFINPNHEPTAYYGVQRNFVETAIIPTTWREAGPGLSGTTANSLTWDAGLTTGFDLTKWDSTSQSGRDSPLRSTHQEGQLAKARNLSVYGTLNWQGVPGLLLGGSVFSGKAGHKTPGSFLEDAAITLFDLHSRYQVGKGICPPCMPKGLSAIRKPITRVSRATRLPSPLLFTARMHKRLTNYGKRKTTPSRRSHVMSAITLRKVTAHQPWPQLLLTSRYGHWGPTSRSGKGLS